MGLHTYGMKKGDKAHEFYNSYFGNLVGATVLEFKLLHEEDEWWPTFAVQLADGRIVQIEISSDEEGNSPGFIFGLERPS
jgi:hypothetical protein